MQFEFSFWLFGLRSGSTRTNKKLVRLSSDDFKNAKAFHIFFRKTPRSAWQRLTDEPEVFPPGVRSNSAKEMFLDTCSDMIAQEIAPAKALKKKAPVEIVAPEKKAPKKKVSEEKSLPSKPSSKKIKEKSLEELLLEDFEKLIEEEVEEEIKEIHLPAVPKPGKITLTKKQFEAQLARILFDELDSENIKWSNRRMNHFIEKMWRGFKHAPHLIADEKFRRQLVTMELVRMKKAKKPSKSLDDVFRKKLENKEVTLDSNVGGHVDIKYKEIFNMQNVRRKDEPTIAVIEDGMIKEKDRQTAFAQISVDYDKNILVRAGEMMSKQKTLESFSKVRADIETVFNEAIQKGVFKPSDEPDYAVRILVPLLNGKGEIPEDYINKKGQRKSGHGYSTARHKVKSKRDLDEFLDVLFDGLQPAMARYVRLNHSSGYMIAGFTIERILK